MKRFERAAELVDDVVGLFSPRAAYNRKVYRFGYDAIDGSRLRKKRNVSGGTEDKHLSETNLWKLREINRDLVMNNPLIDGLFETERDGIIGSGPVIQGRTGDDGLDDDLEAAWKEEMLDKPCDVTGRLNFNHFLGIQFLSYRRDGDSAAIYLEDGLQGIEGEQMGTPYGESAANYEIINGVAYNKQTKRVIGYYIGKSDRWGWIQKDSYGMYKAGDVHHIFNPRRYSQSRGKPALTSAIDWVDKLCGYVDAELVAAKINACFSMFISRKNPELPPLSTQGSSATGLDEEGKRLEKMNPGMILYGEDGEEATGIGMQRPGQMFDPFVQRILTFIGRPMCMPLMLITLDFAGATFMNARIAYQKVQDAWTREQDWVVKPSCSRTWRWKISRLLETGKIKLSNDTKKKVSIFRHEVFCKRWPYVDPWKEAKADETELANRTTTRTEICARKGRDVKDVDAEREKEGGTSPPLTKKEKEKQDAG